MRRAYEPESVRRGFIGQRRHRDADTFIRINVDERDPHAALRERHLCGRKIHAPCGKSGIAHKGMLLAANTHSVIPEGVTVIGPEVFSYTKATRIIIPDGVSKIGLYAFEYATELKSVIIPASVTSIGADAFNSCTALLVKEIIKICFVLFCSHTYSTKTPGDNHCRRKNLQTKDCFLLIHVI